MSSVRAIERRNNQERRKQERRRSIRYTAETLIVIGGVTWIDNEGTDRRRKVRRKDDRERIARTIATELQRYIASIEIPSTPAKAA